MFVVKMLSRVIEEQPLRMIFILRVSPFPQTLLIFLLGCFLDADSVSVFHLALGNAAGSFRDIADVLFGANLGTVIGLLQGQAPDTAGPMERIRMLANLVSLVAAIAGTAYVAVKARRLIRQELGMVQNQESSTGEIAPRRTLLTVNRESSSKEMWTFRIVAFAMTILSIVLAVLCTLRATQLSTMYEPISVKVAAATPQSGDTVHTMLSISFHNPNPEAVEVQLQRVAVMALDSDWQSVGEVHSEKTTVSAGATAHHSVSANRNRNHSDGITLLNITLDGNYSVSMAGAVITLPVHSSRSIWLQGGDILGCGPRQDSGHACGSALEAPAPAVEKATSYRNVWFALLSTLCYASSVGHLTLLLGLLWRPKLLELHGAAQDPDSEPAFTEPGAVAAEQSEQVVV